MLIVKRLRNNKNDSQESLKYNQIDSSAFLHLNKLHHLNLGIFGRTACGKTTLAKSLLTQALAEGTNIIGVDITWANRISELREWAEQQASPIPLTIIEIEREKLEYSSLALSEAITRATSGLRSILCINEADTLQESSQCKQVIEDLCTNKNSNVQVVLISTTISGFSKLTINNLHIRLVGQLHFLDVDIFRKQLDYPEPIIQLCLKKFGCPLYQKYSSWVLDQVESVTAQGRFTIYHHHAS